MAIARNPHPLYAPPGSPKAIGMHPVKDTAQAGGAGYKLVSRSPFKRYGHEDKRNTLKDLTFAQLQTMLHGKSLNEQRDSARELHRRWKGGRMNPLSVSDWEVIKRFFPVKIKPARKPTTDAPTRRRIF